MNGIGAEIGIDLSEAMADVADTVNDLKENLQEMVEDWREQKEEMEEEVAEEDENGDFPHFGENFPFGKDSPFDDNFPFGDGRGDNEGTSQTTSTDFQNGKFVNRCTASIVTLEKLKIDWMNGSVTVMPWDGDHVEVAEYTKTRLASGQKMAVTMKDNEQLTVHYAPGMKNSKWNRSFMDALRSKELVVRIPAQLCGSIEKLKVDGISATTKISGLGGEDFELNTVSGAMRLEGLHAEDLTASTVSGALTAQGLSAETLKLRTVSGTLQAQGVSAETAEFGTVSGSLKAHGNAESFKVSSTSGSIELMVDQCPEDAKFNSVSGSQCLILPENQGFEVKYNSLSGSFHSDFPVTIQGKPKKGTATYGNGETEIHMNTTSGSIKVLRRKE